MRLLLGILIGAGTALLLVWGAASTRQRRRRKRSDVIRQIWRDH